MEGPLASVQVSQEETRGVRLPQPGPKASENIRLVGLRLQFLQVLVAVVLLLRLRVVPVALPILLLQLLLQPVFQTQLVLRQPLQVPVLFLVPVPVPNAFPTQTFRQNQGGAGPASWESRREVHEEASPSSSPTTGP